MDFLMTIEQLHYTPQTYDQEIRDRIKTLKKQEDTYHIHNYLKNYSDSIVLDAIECRVKIVTWLYQVIEYSNLTKETASIAMSYLDRFLSTKEGEEYLYDPRTFQLIGMCCLMLAIKVNESVDVEMSYIEELSKGSYTSSELRETERKILVILEWRMSPPTASVFTEHIVELFPQDIPQSTMNVVKHLSQIQIEIASKDSSFIAIKPSVIAMASVLNAMESLQSYISYEALQNLQDNFFNNHFEIDATCPAVSEMRKRLIKQSNLIDC